MKFLSIPKNGASWREPLLYKFTTESIREQDVEVEIIDELSGDSIGTQRLYGVIEAEIDIGPYVRSIIANMLPYEKLALSPSARKIRVRVGDVESESRMFYRAEVDDSVGHVLSSKRQSAVVQRGEAIRLTAFGRNSVNVRVVDRRTSVRPPVAAINTQGMPVEIAIATDSIAGQGVDIAIEVQCDTESVEVFEFRVVDSLSPRCRVAWYNLQGGIECYSYPTMVRRKYQSEVIEAACAEVGMPRPCRVIATFSLTSAYEPAEQLERLIGVIFSPEVYECCGMGCVPLRLKTRTVDFDDHGGLRRMELSVEKRWRDEV